MAQVSYELWRCLVDYKKKPEISYPTQFEHTVHVGFDPVTGEFTVSNSKVWLCRIFVEYKTPRLSLPTLSFLFIIGGATCKHHLPKYLDILQLFYSRNTFFPVRCDSSVTTRNVCSEDHHARILEF